MAEESSTGKGVGLGLVFVLAIAGKTCARCADDVVRHGDNVVRGADDLVRGADGAADAAARSADDVFGGAGLEGVEKTMRGAEDGLARAAAEAAHLDDAAYLDDVFDDVAWEIVEGTADLTADGIDRMLQAEDTTDPTDVSGKSQGRWTADGVHITLACHRSPAGSAWKIRCIERGKAGGDNVFTYRFSGLQMIGEKSICTQVVRREFEEHARPPAGSLQHALAFPKDKTVCYPRGEGLTQIIDGTPYLETTR